MPTEVLLPQWGMEMVEGTIVRWLKKEGDPIQEGEPLVEIETAKLETDLESSASGVVAQILVPEGSTVPIRTVLAVIAAPGEEISPAASHAPSAPRSAGASTQPTAAGSQQPDPARVQVVPAARRLAQQHGIDVSQVPGSGPRGRVLIEDVEQAIQAPSLAAGAAAPATPAQEGATVQVVPAARRLAGQHGLDLAQVQGSGPNGRILIEDVERAIQSPAQPGAQMVELTGIRRTIATRMMQSLLTTAQVTLTTECDVTQAMALRAGISRQWKGQSLSPLHLVVKAAAQGLKDHPRLNAVQQEDRVQLMEEVNIGIAVTLEEGLITPVLRNADTKSLAELAAESRELAEKTREGRARPEEVT